MTGAAPNLSAVPESASGAAAGRGGMVSITAFPNPLRDSEALLAEAPAGMTVGEIVGEGAGEGAGYCYRSAQDYAPEPLADGHACQPPLDAEADGYGRLRRQWDAKDADGLAALHDSFCRIQHSTFRSGRYPAGFACGGRVQVAAVTRKSLTVRAGAELPDGW